MGEEMAVDFVHREGFSSGCNRSYKVMTAGTTHAIVSVEKSCLGWQS